MNYDAHIRHTMDYLALQARHGATAIPQADVIMWGRLYTALYAPQEMP